MKRFLWKLFGEWRAVYKDGRVSILMPYPIARDYAEIFGGKARPSYEDPVDFLDQPR